MPVDIEIEIGVFCTSRGIVMSAAGIDELMVCAGSRESFGAQEQHMFQKVCQTGVFSRVIEIAGIDIHAGCCLVGSRIGYQQYPQLVGQGEKVVLPFVERAFDDGAGVQGQGEDKQYGNA